MQDQSESAEAAPVCTTCKKVHGRDGWSPMHVPTYEGGNQNPLPPTLKTGRAGVESRRVPGVGVGIVGTTDRGLRLLLIRLGLITREQLEDSDRTLAALAAEYHERHGQEPQG